MAKCKRIIACLLMLAVCMTMITGCSNNKGFKVKNYITDTAKLQFSKYGETEVEPVALSEEALQLLVGFDKKLENEFLQLYYKEATTEVAVADKRSGNLWFTNPQNIEEDELITPDTLGRYRSQMYIEFMDGQTQKVIDNYSACIEKDSFKYKVENDKLTVEYIFVIPIKVDDNKFKDINLFKVNMEYSLQGESLIVSVPSKGIKYKKNTPPLKISVLPHFGSQTNKKEGYVFIPDGCGALMNFNDQKTTPQNYYAPVYGKDTSLNIKEKPQQNAVALMPIFGLKADSNAFLGIIEDGEAFAAINAVRANILSSYNEVYPSFTLFSSQVVSVGDLADAAKVIGAQDTPYMGKMQVRYAILDNKDASYSGMAGYYRDYLIKTQNLKKKSGSQQINLELIGAVDKLKSRFGIQYDGMEALTDTDDAIEIIKELKKMGVDTLNLRYSGWFNGGIKQEFAKKVKPESQVGGKKGIKNLADFAKNNGVKFYPDAELFNIIPNSSGFSKFKYAAKQIDQKDAKAYTYSLVSQEQDGYRYVLTPLQFNNVYAMFEKAYNKLDLPNLSLSSVGEGLNADYTKGVTIDRETSLNITKEVLTKAKKQYSSLMTSNGNAYVVPFSDVITDVPFDNSKLPIIDKAVPFYQMVFHGSITYSGKPLNKSYNYEDEVLKLVEYGGIPYYQLIKADASAIKNSEYSEYCGCSYEFWKEDVAKTNKFVDAALKDVKDQYIINHEALSDNVFKTTYENGVSVYVNYGTADYQNGDVLVEARNYAVTEAGK